MAKKVNENLAIAPAELQQIRGLSDFDLLMLLSETHDHGWDAAVQLLPLMVEQAQAQAARTGR